MADNNLQIQIDAVDNASAVLQGVGGSVENLLTEQEKLAIAEYNASYAADDLNASMARMQTAEADAAAATAAATQAKKDEEAAIKAEQQAQDQANKTMGQVGSAAATAVIGVASLAAAIGLLVTNIKESVSSAIDQEKSMALLKDKITQVGGSFAEASPQIQEFITRQEALGFGTAEVSGVLADATQKLGDYKEAEGAVALAEAIHIKTGKDLTDVTQQLVMVENGRSRSLAALGIDTKKFVGVQAQLNELIKEYGTIGSAVQDTVAFKTQVANAKWEDMKTELGNALLPVVQKVENAFYTFFQVLEAGGHIISALGDDMMGVGQAMIDIVSGHADKAISGMTKFFDMSKVEAGKAGTEFIDAFTKPLSDSQNSDATQKAIKENQDAMKHLLDGVSDAGGAAAKKVEAAMQSMQDTLNTSTEKMTKINSDFVDQSGKDYQAYLDKTADINLQISDMITADEAKKTQIVTDAAAARLGILDKENDKKLTAYEKYQKEVVDLPTKIVAAQKARANASTGKSGDQAAYDKAQADIDALEKEQKMATKAIADHPELKGAAETDQNTDAITKVEQTAAEEQKKSDEKFADATKKEKEHYDTQLKKLTDKLVDEQKLYDGQKEALSKKVNDQYDAIADAVDKGLSKVEEKMKGHPLAMSQIGGGMQQFASEFASSVNSSSQAVSAPKDTAAAASPPINIMQGATVHVGTDPEAHKKLAETISKTVHEELTKTLQSLRLGLSSPR